MQEFKIGAVLGDTFNVLFRNILPFGAMAVVIYGVLTALEVAFGANVIMTASEGEFYPTNMGVFWAILIAGLLFGFFLSAMITYGTYQDIRGRKAGFADCVGRGITLVLPVVGVSIIVMFTVAFFSLFLIIPGIIAMVMLYVVVPVVVVERPGTWASLGRSRDLTKGHRWAIFAILLVLGIVAGIVGAIAELITAGLGMTAGIFLGLLSQSFNAAIMAIGPAVAYYHLRRAKEGIEIEQIASVFD